MKSLLQQPLGKSLLRKLALKDERGCSFLSEPLFQAPCKFRWTCFMFSRQSVWTQGLDWYFYINSRLCVCSRLSSLENLGPLCTQRWSSRQAFSVEDAHHLLLHKIITWVESHENLSSRSSLQFYPHCPLNIDCSEISIDTFIESTLTFPWVKSLEGANF